MLVLIKVERDIVISRSRNYLIEDISSQVYFKNITQVSNIIIVGSSGLRIIKKGGSN